jgi:hypothetical protein
MLGDGPPVLPGRSLINADRCFPAWIKGCTRAKQARFDTANWPSIMADAVVLLLS